MILDLIHNVALLVALAVGLQLLAWRMERRPVLYRLATGLLFGGVGIVGMMTPMHFAPGVIYDGRSIVLSLAGLFGGPIAALVSGLICGAYRAHLGGAGAVAGIGTVIEAAALGTGIYYLRRRNEAWAGLLRLWAFALLVHVIMMALQLLIPNVGLEVLRRIGPSVLFFYPIAFLLIAQVFLNGENRRKAEKALTESEAKYRELVENTNNIILRMDNTGTITFFNDFAARFFGFSREEIVGRNVMGAIVPVKESTGRDLREMILDIAVHPERYRNNENENMRKDGTRVWIAWNNTPVMDAQGRCIEILCVANDITERRRAEEALRESEAKYRRLVETTDTGYVILDEQGRVRDANQKYVELAGYDHLDEILNRSVVEWTSESAREQNANAIAQCATQGFIRGFEVEYVHRNGACVPIEINATVVKTDSGISILSLCRDVTPRKQAEEALRKSESNLGAIFGAMTESIFLIDLEGNVIAANEELCRRLGTDLQTLTGSNIFAFLPPEVAETRKRQFEKIRESGEPLQFEDERLGRTYLNSLYQIHGADGSLTSLAFFSIDITDRKRAERALRNSEELFRGMAEQLPDVLFQTDTEGILTYLSPCVVRMFGWTPEEIAGRHVTEFLVENEIPKALETLRYALASGNLIRNLHLTMKRRDGSTFPGELSGSRAVRDGGVVGVLGVVRDITEYERAEAQRQTHIHFLESLEQIDQAIKEETDLEQMLWHIVRMVFSIFGCDRAWLLYPSDPDAPSFRVPVEVTRPEYPGANVLNVDVPMSPDMAQNLREALESDAPVTYAIGTEKPINKVTAEQFGVKSQMFAVIYPKMGKPWVVGVHQCSYPRIWTNEEIRLFKEIGRRISDGLSSVLYLRELQENEARFRATFEQAAVGIAHVALDGRWLRVNQKFCDIVGYSREELLERTFLDITHPDDRDADLEYARKVLAGEIPTYCIEKRYIRKDGSIVWIDLTVSLVSSASGEPGYFISVIEDINVRKHAEEALRRSNRELRAISECNQTVLRAVDEETFVNEVCRIICSEAGYRLAWVGYAERDDAKTIRPVAWAGFDSEYMSDAKLSWADDSERGRGPAGEAIRSGETIYVQDFTTDPQMALWRESALQRGYRSGIALPLKDENSSVFGVLLLYSSEPNAITPDEIRLMEELSHDLAFGIVALRTRAERKLVEDIRQARLLLLEFAESHSLDELLTATLDQIETLTGSTIGFYHFLESDQETLSLQTWSTNTLRNMCTASGKGSHYAVAQAGVWVDCVHQRGPVIHNDYAALPHRKGMPEGHAPVTREVVVPVFRGNLIRAIVGVGNKPADYVASDIEIVSQLADLSWDIVERKRAEEQIRRTAEEWQSTFDSITDLVSIQDADFKLVRVNRTYASTLGSTPEALVGKRCYEIVHGTTCPIPECPHHRTVTTGEASLEEILEQHLGIYLEVSTSPIHDAGGKVIGTVHIAKNITERKRAETEQQRLEGQLRQAQKMEAVGQLAGGVAHDFNNLLQVILGTLDLIQLRSEPGSPNNEWLEEIRKAADRAADLTRQLLAFSRRQIIQPVNLDLNDLITGILRMIRRVIGEDIALRFLPGERLGTVRADKGHIEQVLMNLCVNARDAMPSGGTLTIETENVVIGQEYCHEHPWAIEGRYALLSVTDTGCGMDEATQAQIFEPFFTTKEVGKGTGLGLATAYGIVKQHNGLIHVYSEPEKGTALKIYLPIVERPAEDVGSKIEDPAVGGTETILVAEDEEPVRRLVTRMLESAGYTVLPASDGEEALRVFTEHANEVDMVLLDVVMPRLGGRGVMDRIHPAYPQMRFLFSSGYTGNAIHTDFVIKTGLRLITKPYRKADLLRAVRETLDGPPKDGE